MPRSTKPPITHPDRMYNKDFRELNTTEYVRLRNQFRATHPYCVRCEKKGILRLGTRIDHIIPRHVGGPVYKWDNLQNLCDEHTIEKDIEDSHRYNTGFKKTPKDKSGAFTEPVYDFEKRVWLGEMSTGQQIHMHGAGSSKIVRDSSHPSYKKYEERMKRKRTDDLL